MIDTPYHIILASNSPRRKELLGGLDLEYEVRVVPGIEENYPDGLTPEQIPQYLACQKAQAYTLSAGEMLITADTVVVLDGEVLGKPADEAEAKAMLAKLSGKTHTVVTGVALTTLAKQHAFHVVTEVTFKQFTPQEIDYYVTTYHPRKYRVQPQYKAGAYGIQEWIGFIGVTALKGSFFNVMGLPVQRIYEEIFKF